MNIYRLLEKVRNQKPLVFHLTNYVTMYDCANIVKVLGASPVMAEGREEIADMAKLASALVLNIGTLTTDHIELMKIAAKSANEKGIPIVLDVCGAGATRFRDQKSLELLDSAKISIIKGNASEVARIAGENVQTKGVDAGEINQNLKDVAGRLARERQAAVVITGAEDIAADAKKTYVIKNGHELMAQVVGTGCMATSVIGAFAAVEKDFALASAAGLCCFGIAAELAAGISQGPGSFKVNLFDRLYHLKSEDINRLQKVI